VLSSEPCAKAARRQRCHFARFVHRDPRSSGLARRRAGLAMSSVFDRHFTVRSMGLAILVLCVLDLLGVLPHGRAADKAAGEIALCKLARVGRKGSSDSSDFCPPPQGKINVQEYKGVVLCSVAAKGFEARALARKNGSALKHGLLVLADWWRFGGSTLEQTYKGMRRRISSRWGQRATGEQVLEAMVAPGGPFPARHIGEESKWVNVARNADAPASAAAAAAAGRSPAEAAPGMGGVIETIFLYFLLFLIVLLLLFCRHGHVDDDEGQTPKGGFWTTVAPEETEAASSGALPQVFFSLPIVAGCAAAAASIGAGAAATSGAAVVGTMVASTADHAHSMMVEAPIIGAMAGALTAAAAVEVGMYLASVPTAPPLGAGGACLAFATAALGVETAVLCLSRKHKWATSRTCIMLTPAVVASAAACGAVVGGAPLLGVAAAAGSVAGVIAGDPESKERRARLHVDDLVLIDCSAGAVAATLAFMLLGLSGLAVGDAIVGAVGTGLGALLGTAAGIVWGERTDSTAGAALFEGVGGSLGGLLGGAIGWGTLASVVNVATPGVGGALGGAVGGFSGCQVRGIDYDTSIPGSICLGGLGSGLFAGLMGGGIKGCVGSALGACGLCSVGAALGCILSSPLPRSDNWGGAKKKGSALALPMPDCFCSWCDYLRVSAGMHLDT